MKNFYILPLVCAIAALSACSSAPVKQEIIPVAPQPAPQPVVLQKVEPETSAPHYRLNARDYKQPLNPVIVQKIREALTPKIINPATGEVVTRLPLIVPVQAANAPTLASTAPSSNSLNTLDPTQPGLEQSQAGNTANMAGSADNPADNPNNPAASTAITSPVALVTASANAPSTPATDSYGIPVAEPQDTQAALLKIDPALKLDDQAVARIAASQNQAAAPDLSSAATTTPADNTQAVNTQPDNTQPGNTQAVPVDSTAAPTTVPVVSAAIPAAPVQTAADNSAKILIPIHQLQITQSAGTPAPRDEVLDVTEIDKDITLIEGKARHYPTYFKDKYERWKAEKKIRALTQQLDMLAVDPRASYDLLLRAMKAHVLARNMDTGPDSAFKSAVYFQRLLKLKPADPETSFWYGFSLGEGGGFRESISHLDTAVNANYQEAYLALAHSYLQMEDKTNALTVLNNYKIKYPDESSNTDRLIAEIEAGNRYSIWQ